MTKPIYRVKAEYFKALGNPTRIRILELLAEGERSAGDLVSDMQLEQSNVSQQLSVLRERGIVDTRRDGPIVYYRVKDPRTFRLLALAKDILTTSLKETRGLLSELADIDFGEARRAKKTRPRPT